MNTLSPLSDCSNNPEWTFIRNKGQSQDFKTQQLEAKRYSFANYGMVEAPCQDPEQQSASIREAILDARLGQTMVQLQVWRQRFAARRMYMFYSGGRVFLASASRPRQRLHSNFENAPWNEKNEKWPNDTEAENRKAGYFVMVSGALDMPL